jgi:phosphopantetheinyl transferase
VTDRGAPRGFDAAAEFTTAEVWYRTTDSLNEADLGPMLATLSPEERDQSGRFRRATDRRDYVAAHALMRESLAGAGGSPPASWRIEPGPNGKPMLGPGQQAFEINLSHTDGLVACALTRAGPVGIDVEAVHHARDIDGLARLCLANHEIAALAACRADVRPIRFVELWTLKEAFLKAVGSGLSDALVHFGFWFEGDSGLRFQPPPGEAPDGWQFALFAPSDKHRLAVAVRCPETIGYAVRDGSPQPRPVPISPTRCSLAS